VREGSKSLPQVAKDLDLTESALRNWVNQADVDEGKSPAGALTTAEPRGCQRIRSAGLKLCAKPRRDYSWKIAPTSSSTGCSLGLPSECGRFAGKVTKSPGRHGWRASPSNRTGAPSRT
jgi:transposase